MINRRMKEDIILINFSYSDNNKFKLIVNTILTSLS